MLIRDAEVDGVPGLDVRIEARRIVDVGRRLTRRAGEEVHAADGGALIPGLHDHHVHLRAWAATRWSVPLGDVHGPEAFDRRLRTAAGSAPDGIWLRGVGWHERAHGELDRARLDALTGGRPARVQHRTGALWVLNSAALALTGAPDDVSAATGRLHRLDDWLRARVAAVGPDPFPAAVRALGAEAAGYGVTRFTDATPGRDRAETEALTGLGLPQLLRLMSPTGVGPGPQKIVLDDPTLPPVETLARTIRGIHRSGSAVAVHCVTAEQLVTLVAAVEEAGRVAGDRVEHAGIVPPGYADRLAALGLAVVTNPGFLADRGDAYRREVRPPERDWLYPARSLLDAGVTLAAATDAPFGPADPWIAIAAAVDRLTPDGEVLGPHERISPSEALALFHRDPDGGPGRAGGAVRRVAVGQPADVCLLHVPLDVALRAPSSENVRTTF
ncbi:amidohydrolase family protein [Cryptosporangium phraense]|uniref:Amidohydrolase family protein n=1 Tax=Cryptosporangium phraense TaxID=2593070 RepID=A0A545AN46_9ACTN|nr:amidohydrolase family protein [Cryptosporangium phraense]TQS42681.1 amidohydrolase family protein [Cryptosporangium phraense]